MIQVPITVTPSLAIMEATAALRSKRFLRSASTNQRTRGSHRNTLGSKVLDQSLVVPPGKKRYDVYGVRKRDGKIIQVWFLISGGIDGFIEHFR